LKRKGGVKSVRTTICSRKGNQKQWGDRKTNVSRGDVPSALPSQKDRLLCYLWGRERNTFVRKEERTTAVSRLHRSEERGKEVFNRFFEGKRKKNSLRGRGEQILKLYRCRRRGGEKESKSYRKNEKKKNLREELLPALSWSPFRNAEERDASSGAPEMQRGREKKCESPVKNKGERCGKRSLSAQTLWT